MPPPNRTSGLHWSLLTGKINFFGATGQKLNEKLWGINGFGGDTLTTHAPESMMPRIRECIANDVANGNGDKIAQVQLGARQAVVFFLEGMLTCEQLQNAAEGFGFIDVPGVVIDDRTLTVRITANPKHKVATADILGNILPLH